MNIHETVTEDDLEIVKIDGKELRADPEGTRDDLLERIDSRTVVLARGFLTDAEVRGLRKEAEDLAEAQPPRWYPYWDGGPDFHHIDFNTPHDDRRRLEEGRPTRPRHFHLHKFMLWNDHRREFDEAARAAIRLRNVVNGTDPDKGLAPNDPFFTVVQLVQYHRGGDYLGEHHDREFHERQGLTTRAELITLLSKRGEDFEEGGLFVKPGDRKHYLEAHADPGDVAIYDVTNPHGCDPVDPDHPGPIPSRHDGRWIMLVPPYKKELHFQEPPGD